MSGWSLLSPGPRWPQRGSIDPPCHCHPRLAVDGSSKSERHAGRQEEARPARRAGELRADPCVPHEARRQLIAHAHLGADDVRLMPLYRLFSEDIDDQSCPGEPRGTDRVARSEHQLVPPVALAASAIGQELVAAVEMKAHALERFGDDALQLDSVSSRIDPGRRVETQLQRERGEADRLLVEVVERAQHKVARLRAPVDLPRIGREDRAQAKLEVRIRAFESKGAVLVEIPVVDRESGLDRAEQQQHRDGNDLGHQALLSASHPGGAPSAPAGADRWEAQSPLELRVPMAASVPYPSSA